MRSRDTGVATVEYYDLVLGRGSVGERKHLTQRKAIVAGRGALCANIDETESAAIITEQGGQENHRGRNQGCSSFCDQLA